MSKENEVFMRFNDGKFTSGTMDLGALKKACVDAITPIGNMSDSPVLSGLLKGTKFHGACDPNEILAIVNELEESRFKIIRLLDDIKTLNKQQETDRETIANLNKTLDESDQRQILSWCASLEEAKLNGEFEHKDTDSYFLSWVKTICQLATMDLKG
jgi:hypothetical protein